MNLFSTAWHRDNRLPTLFIALLAVILPFYAWHEDTSGFVTDDAMYLLLADFFSPFAEPNFPVDHLVITKARFPPAFPVLIGLLGGGPDNMPVAHLVTAGCFILSAVMLFLWARRALGVADVALACLVVYALMPETIFYINEIRSEFLYIALVFGVFLLLDAAPKSPLHERELLIGAAFVVGLCLVTRTIGVALLGAFTLHLLLNRKRRAPVYVAVALLLPAAWLVIKTVNGYSGNYVEDLEQYTHLTGIIELLTHDVPSNAVLMVRGWQEHLAVAPGSPLVYRVLSLVLLALGAVGFVCRIRRKAVDALYVALYIPPILVWPHPFHIPRLIYPLVPVFVVYAFIGIRALSSRLPDRQIRFSHAAALALFLLLIYPNTLNIVDRYFSPVPQSIPEDFRHTRSWLEDRDFEKVHDNAEIKHRVITLLKRAGNHLTQRDCMYAVHPVSAILYADRPAIMMSSDPAPEKMQRCDYLFVMNLIGEYEALFPLGNMSLEHLRLLDEERDSTGSQQAFLFRLNR